MNYTIKDLEWREVDGAAGDAWYAESPSAPNGDGIYIHYEQGSYWFTSSVFEPGFDTLAEAQSAGQKFHNRYIAQFLVPSEENS